MRKLLQSLSLVIAFFAIFTVQAQTNLISSWNGNLLGYQQTAIANTEVNKWGWASTYTGATWGTAGGGGVRFMDVTTTHYLSDGTTPFVGREFLYRWDGSYWGSTLSLGVGNGTTTTVTPISLTACKTYTFTGLYEWWANGSQPTYSFSFSTAQTGGTIIATKSFSYPITTTARLQPISFTFNCPTTGTYYLQVKQTNGTASASGTLIGLANLSLVENTTEALTINKTFMSFDEVNNSETFSVNGNILTNDVTLTAPAGITLSTSSITAADAQCGVTVTTTYDGTTTPTSDYINITSGTFSSRIRVRTAKNTDCFTKLYLNGTNLVADPYLNSLTTFGGWGVKSISTDSAQVYCGSRSGTIGAGSIDRVLTGTLKANTKYRVKAMINSTNTALNLGVYGWSNGQADYVVHPTVVNAWAPVEMTFTTGATLAATQGLFFNNAAGSYIDNWEMYSVPKVYPSSTTLTYLGVGTKKVSVRAESLTSNIAISAPAGFSVSPTTMLSTVSGSTSDSLTVTFNGPNSASGYVYFVSGSVKDSIQVTGTVAPSVLASVPGMIFDDLNTTGNFIVNGGNLTSDIAITAPAGITVNPTTIPAASASNVTVNVTYDGTTSNVVGDIVLTSGTTVTNVAVKATKNTDCFTPLYSSLTNLIPSPEMNTLTGFAGWGHKAVVAGEAYCGMNCVKFTATTNAYSDGAAMDVNNIPWEANSTYRLHAWVKAVDGTFAFFAKGTAPDVTISVPQNTEWVLIDQTFTTGTAPTANFFSFNNVDGASTGKIAYIDNYELYNITSLVTGVNQIVDNNYFTTYVAASKIVADFNLAQTSAVELSVYNAQGMLITKESATYAAGKNHKVINANIPSGVYMVKMISNGKSVTTKLIK